MYIENVPEFYRNNRMISPQDSGNIEETFEVQHRDYNQ